MPVSRHVDASQAAAFWTQGMRQAALDDGVPPERVDAPAFTRLAGGGNNRAYAVAFGDRPRYVLKQYFRHQDDPRDRLGAETAFYRYAQDVGAGPTPRLLGVDVEAGLALLEHIQGRAPSEAEIDADAVEQALRFFEQINAADARPRAQGLPLASEACWSFDEHLRRVRLRLERAQAVVADDAASSLALDFARGELLQTGLATLDAVANRLARRRLPADAVLPLERRCVSPSDFGFHNAIVRDGGERGEGDRSATGPRCFVFHDFEYAGWDDPAKTVCDFFCQPRLPVSMERWNTVAARVANSLGLRGDSADAEIERYALLLPAYRVKWACVLLNEFLPVSSHRRSFAEQKPRDPQGRLAQVDKARAMLTRVGSTQPRP